MLNTLFFRRRYAGPAAGRLEVCPPALLAGFAEPLGERLMGWLRASPLRRAGAQPPRNRLPTVKREFALSLEDVPTREALVLRTQVETARSLRELWHLRAAVFGQVSCHHSQQEATLRLARLNRHFPTRAPRSGFTPLD